MVKVNAIFTPEGSENVGPAKRDAMHLDNVRAYLESSPDIEDVSYRFQMLGEQPTREMPPKKGICIDVLLVRGYLAILRRL